MDKRLYIVVRNELASMTTGRIAAQASHASTKAMQDIIAGKFGAEHKEMFQEWLKEANGFGTTIVLQPKNTKNQTEEIYALVEHGIKNGLSADVVVDPEYFIKDGEHVFILPDVLTCAYFFGETDLIRKTVDGLDLL